VDAAPLAALRSATAKLAGRDADADAGALPDGKMR